MVKWRLSVCFKLGKWTKLTKVISHSVQQTLLSWLLRCRRATVIRWSADKQYERRSGWLLCFVIMYFVALASLAHHFLVCEVPVIDDVYFKLMFTCISSLPRGIDAVFLYCAWKYKFSCPGGSSFCPGGGILSGRKIEFSDFVRAEPPDKTTSGEPWAYKV